MMLGGQLLDFSKEYIFKAGTSLKSIKPHTKVRNLRILERVKSKCVSLFTVTIEKDFKYLDIATPYENIVGYYMYFHYNFGGVYVMTF